MRCMQLQGTAVAVRTLVCGLCGGVCGGNRVGQGLSGVGVGDCSFSTTTTTTAVIVLFQHSTPDGTSFGGLSVGLQTSPAQSSCDTHLRR